MAKGTTEIPYKHSKRKHTRLFSQNSGKENIHKQDPPAEVIKDNSTKQLTIAI